MKWWSILSLAAGLAACGRLGYEPLPPAASACATEVAGTRCDDGFRCTEDDACDGAGACVGIPNDTVCASGAFCQPDCFVDATGCGTAPTAVTVRCDPAGNTGQADCTVSALGASPVQSSCFTCDTTVGFVPLLRSDFESTPGVCSDDGWQLASGNLCTDSVAGCTPQGAIVPCCSDFSSICDERFGGASLQSVVEENCGGGFEEWRASQAVDASQVENLRLCYDASEAYAESQEAIIALVSDTVSSQQLDCVLGDTDWRGGFETRCTGLPSWADNNPALRVGFIVHNNTVHPGYPGEVRRMSLDNVALYGNDPACPGTKRSLVFQEDFSGCPDPLSAGYNGWAIDLGTPACSFSACNAGGQGLVAENTDWTIQRTIDTSSLSGDVQLCFDVGHVNASDVTEGVSASIDVGDGMGWQRAGRGSLYRANDSQCQEMCFSLSAISPAAAHNPKLGIEISARSSAAGRFTFIDDVSVSGVESCAGAAFVDVSPLSEAGTSAYDFTLSNLSPNALSAQLSCTWSGGGAFHVDSTMVRLP